jgi:hypothetical protein
MTVLCNRWPTFAPIKIYFNRDLLKKEIIDSKILDKGFVATSHLKDNKNFWDNGTHFRGQEFAKQSEVPLWNDETKQFLVKKDINTFYQVNLTEFSGKEITDVWEGTHESKTKIPLWIKNDFSWKVRTDVNLPYLQEVINSLGLTYFSMIRIVYQTPPSIGLIHKDSGPKTNLEYYNKGGVGITLNVSSGGGNLYFVDSEGNENSINEEDINAWHFDDSALHCTNEITSERIQIRIYGNHYNYKELMNLEKAIY